MTDPSQSALARWLQLRASNLVLLASAPFFIYLFATSAFRSRSSPLSLVLRKVLQKSFKSSWFSFWGCWWLDPHLSCPQIAQLAFLSTSSLLVGTDAAPFADVLAPHTMGSGAFLGSVIGDLLDARSNPFRDPKSIIQPLLRRDRLGCRDG